MRFRVLYARSHIEFVLSLDCCGNMTIERWLRRRVQGQVSIGPYYVISRPNTPVGNGGKRHEHSLRVHLRGPRSRSLCREEESDIIGVELDLHTKRDKAIYFLNIQIAGRN
jgi:hypothetical protein